MDSQVFCVSENHVTQGARLDTDVQIDHLLLQVWEQEELEAMPNSLRAELDGALQVATVSIVCFSSVETSWHWLTIYLDFVLVGQDFFSILLDLVSEVLFVDHVESDDELSEACISVSGSLFQVI